MGRSNRNRLLTPGVLSLALVGLGVGACMEETPTTLDEGLLPGEPVTVEIELAWDEFASNLEVFGGYGQPRQIGSAIVANAFGGALTARTLVRFGQYPIEVVVQDTLGSTQIEQDIEFVGGRVLVRLDTLASTNGRTPVTLSVGSVQDPWDAVSVNWTNSIDSIGVQVAWPEAGAGPVRVVSATEWDPTQGDTVLIELDSASVADMADSDDPARGIRIDLETPGERVEVDDVQLRLDILPASNPDTVVTDTLPRLDMTFVYDPPAAAPVDEVRIGGVPAWRTVVDIGLPAQLTGPPELCAAVGCPLVLEPEQVSYAAIVLRSRQVDPPFAPSDSLSFDARAVLNRASGAKAPLGSSLLDIFDLLVGPEIFSTGGLGTAMEIPITPFVRDLLTDTEPGAFPPPDALALLATLEPISFSYASFHGPAAMDLTLRPSLRLIVTVGPVLDLP